MWHYVTFINHVLRNITFTTFSNKRKQHDTINYHTMSPQADSDLDKLGPRKRRAPVDDNGEPVTISTNTGRKKQKAAMQPSNKSGHTSTNSQKKKKTTDTAQKASLAAQPAQPPHPNAPPIVAVTCWQPIPTLQRPSVDSEAEENPSDDGIPCLEVISIDSESDDNDDEVEKKSIPEVPDIESDEKELGL